MKLTSIPECIRSISLSGLLAFSLTSCISTSLSNPSGSGHDRDLSVYDLTGVSANPTEAEIHRAAASSGTLPMRGAKFLLVQSGAVQPGSGIDGRLQVIRPSGALDGAGGGAVSG